MAGYEGLIKTTKDQEINHYFKETQVISICHIADTLFLVGFHYYGLIIWNEETDLPLLEICQDRVFSIKRILTTNTFIIKTD